MREWDLCFYIIREREEGGGVREHGLNFCDRDAMISEGEEPVCFGGVDQFASDGFDAVGEVVKRDFRDRTVGVFGWCHCEVVDELGGAMRCVW